MWQELCRFVHHCSVKESSEKLLNVDLETIHRELRGIFYGSLSGPGLYPYIILMFISIFWKVLISCHEWHKSFNVPISVSDMKSCQTQHRQIYEKHKWKRLQHKAWNSTETACRVQYYEATAVLRITLIILIYIHHLYSEEYSSLWDCYRSKVLPVDCRSQKYEEIGSHYTACLLW